MADLFAVKTGTPVEFVAGETVTWDADVPSGYASALYRVNYSFRPVTTGPAIAQVTTWSGTSHRVTWAAAVTVGYLAGKYNWQAMLERISDGAKIEIGSGVLTILPNLAGAGGDLRSHAKKMVDKIESILEGRADSDVAAYTINTRSISKMSPKELMEWRNYYRSEVLVEDNLDAINRGDPSQNTITVRFS